MHEHTNEHTMARHLRAQQLSLLSSGATRRDRLLAPPRSDTPPIFLRISGTADWPLLQRIDVGLPVHTMPTPLPCAVQIGDEGPVPAGSIWLYLTDRLMQGPPPLRFLVYKLHPLLTDADPVRLEFIVSEEFGVAEGSLFTLEPRESDEHPLPAKIHQGGIDACASVAVVRALDPGQRDDARAPVIGTTVIVMLRDTAESDGMRSAVVR